MTSTTTTVHRLRLRPNQLSVGPDGLTHSPHLGWATRRGRAGLFFVLPLFVLYLLFMLTPVGYAIYTSLFKTTLVGGTHFAGLANYANTLTSSVFWHSMGRVMLFAVVQVPITLILATFFAVLFDVGLTRYGRVLRMLFFLPFTVPAVVAAVMWSYLLEPQFGPFSRLASTLGFHGANYFSPNLILPTIIVIVIWEVTGWNMIVLYTALKAVPDSVMEAAAMDGASLRRAIIQVKLPMVRPAIVKLLFLNTIGALQLFTEPMMLATFQPQAVSYGFTPTVYIYNTAVSSNEYNLAAAAAVLFALLILVMSVTSLLFRRRLGGLA